jgi:hypothetical protein
MAQIPGTADLGQNIAQPTRTPLSSPELYGAGLGRAVEQAGNERLHAERQAAAAAEAQRKAAARAQAMSELQIAQDDMAALNDEIAQGVKTGQLPKGDAGTVWKERSDERIARALENIPAEFQDLSRRELGARANRFGRNVGAAVLQRDQHDVRAGIDQTLEYASRMYARGERAQADAMVQGTLESLGPFSGLEPDVLQRKGQAYREASRYTRAAAMVTDARRSNQALDKVEKALAGDEFADMDPQRKQQLLAQVEGFRVSNDQRAAAAAQRAQAEADRRLRVAESTFNAASTLINEGKALSPEYVQQATQAMAGSPYLAAFRESLKTAPERAAFGQQPLAVQQQALLGLRAQLNQRGTDPKIEKLIGELETIYRKSVQDYAADPLPAALERGLLQSIEPIRTDSIPGLVATIGVRVAQAQLVQQQVGEAVSPLLKTEAQALGKLINVLPVEQRASAVAQLAQAVGGPVAQALGRQIAGEDKALGLAIAAGAAQTTSNRFTSELILKGAQAIKDKTIKDDDQKVIGWRAEIAGMIGGAYQNDLQREAAIESAFLVRAGLAAENTGDNAQAVRLATGGITERNGKKVPLPYGMHEDDFAAKLKKLTPANASAPEAFIGGKPMPITDFLARVPDAQLVHAGKSRYGVMAGGSLATDAKGNPLIIEVR